MEIDPKKNSRKDNYKLLIGGVLPRPIAWITSKGKNGVVNAAPFSFFNVVATAPPLLGVSVMRKPSGEHKDTSRNILESGEFVIQVVDENLLEKMNHTSCDYPSDVSEIEKSGLSLMESRKISVPRIAEARIHFECRLHQHLELGEGPNTDFIIGEVIQIHVHDDLWRNGKIDTISLAPVGRMAGLDYTTLGKIISLPRPSYKE